MKFVVFRGLVTKEMISIVTVLAGYGNNDSKLRVGDKVDFMVSYSLHWTFCREFSISCIEDWVVADCVVLLLKESVSWRPSFLMIRLFDSSKVLRYQYIEW